MRRWQPPEIEDVVEPCRRRHMIMLSEFAPHVALEWCYKKNCGFGPEDFGHASSVRAWFTCPDCRRDYKAQIYNRTTNDSGCSYCTSKKVCDDNSLSARSPAVAREWHPTKNGLLRPCDITFQSKKPAWWLCSTCNHSWQCQISDRTGHNSCCPECYKRRMQEARDHPRVRQRANMVLNEKANKISRVWYEKWDFIPISKSHPKVAKEWHPIKNGKWTPDDFTHGSEVSAWWLCSKGPDHEWQAQIYSRTAPDGTGCPCCSGKKVSVTNSLQSLFPQIAAQLHPTKNGGLRADQVTAHSDKTIWWLCDCGHEWRNTIGNRTAKLSGCRKCGKKPGQKLRRKA